MSDGGTVKASVYLTGPSVLLAGPQNKKSKTPIIIASVIVVSVILIIAAVVITVYVKFPHMLPSWATRTTEENGSYSLHTN